MQYPPVQAEHQSRGPYRPSSPLSNVEIMSVVVEEVPCTLDTSEGEECLNRVLLGYTAG